MLVKTCTIYISLGAAAVFQVSDGNPRERLGGNRVSTNISFRRNVNFEIFKFNNKW
ncbi:MAG: hypothetical protein LBC68_03160 [Prevotellaceae bacterium]|nr:hypothetical protein [Prevotellaceae bacterium]